MRALPLALSGLLLATGPSAAEGSVKGNIVTAKSGAAALILWDATPEVAQAVSDQTPPSALMLELERQALQILRDKSEALSHSSTLTIRVLYEKIGAVSPVYNTPTFGGDERLFELTVPRQALFTQYDKLAAAAARGEFDAPAQLNVTGTLPQP